MHNHGRHPHLTALTGLRGIAATGIVLHHYTLYLFPATGNAVKQFTPFLVKNYLWVDFFFILSGFILTHIYQQTFTKQIKRGQYIAFLQSRLARIYPLHIITLIFLICLETVKLYLIQTHGIGDLHDPPFTGKQSLESIFSNIFLLQAFHGWTYWNEPAWAISAEWLLYLVVPLLIFLSKHNNRLINTGTLTIAFIALYILSYRYNGLDYASWRSLIRCSAEVTIGIISYKLTYQQKQIVNFPNSWSTNLILVCLLATMAMEINHVITVGLFVLLINSSAKLHKHALLTNRFLLFLGTISYSLYMIHWCILDVIKLLSFSLTGQYINSTLPLQIQEWLLLLAIPVTICISTICYYLIEQPLRKMINQYHRI